MNNGNKCDISKYPKPVRECLIKAIEFQQNIYELSSDWNHYKESEHEYLKSNIRYCLGENSGGDEDQPADVEKKKQERIEYVYGKICGASNTKKSLYVGVVFNVLCESSPSDTKDKNDKENQKDKPFGFPVPIFKVRKCRGSEEKLKCKNNGMTENKEIGQTALYPYCVHYVDSEGRVYKNWTDYVTNNTLPKCLMVLPMGGFYQANPNAMNTPEKTYAWIEIGPSPAATEILSYFDTASTVLGLGALGVGIATLAAPAAIVGSVVTAGSVCGAVSGVYTTVRSGQHLVDRHEHQQSIAPTDRTARSAWFGVIGGAASGLVSGASFVLTKAVKAGATVGNVGRTAYNTIAIGNIVINGMGIGNGVCGIIGHYREKKEVSALEIGQVMAHILFFGNAVINFQNAQTMINNTQRQVLQEYEGSLRSNKHRKAFRRIKRNTHATNSDQTTADAEIIRGVRSIKNKDDFFAGVVRNRKVFSASKAEVTFKDGYAMINDNVQFDPVQLSRQPNEVKINTVNAAEPLAKVSKSFLPRSSRIPVSDYKQQISAITEILKPVLQVAETLVVSESVHYLGKLILDMQGFTKKDCERLILKLAEFALRLVEKNKYFITSSLEEIMHHVWHSYVRPKVDSTLQDLGIDVSNMVNFSDSAELVFAITLGVINGMYDAIENLLKDIIESRSRRLAEEEFITNSDKCNICLGYALIDY